jgi:hypothetical protein
MKMALLAMMLCWLLALPVRGDQSNLILVVDGVTYSNVTFTTVTPTVVSIIHQTGAATVPLDKLPAELQKQFNYDPKKAAEYRLTLARRPVASDPGTPGREIIARKAHLTAVGVSGTGVAAFNVAESPFGAYDKKIFKAVEGRWFALIDRFGMYERAGTVTVYFELLDDGKIRGMKVSDNTAGQILSLFCEKAIIESGPFDPLPANLRALAGKEPREASFTFSY